jgi:hypothetical protein
MGRLRCQKADVNQNTGEGSRSVLLGPLVVVDITTFCRVCAVQHQGLKDEATVLSCMRPDAVVHHSGGMTISLSAGTFSSVIRAARLPKWSTNRAVGWEVS